MRDLAEQQGLGITVDRVDPMPAPPGALLNDFSKVVQASAEHDTTLSQADIYRSKTLGDARGQKESRTNTAGAEKSRAVGLIGAEADQFLRAAGRLPAQPGAGDQPAPGRDLQESLGQRPVHRRPARRERQLQFRVHLGEPLPPLTLSTNQTGP